MPADPRLLTASFRAQKLLETYGITGPAEIVLEDIAWALGIEIVTAPLAGAEAHLVRVGNTGTITLSDAITEVGRRRFAIAHELGHWELHKDVSQSFFCSEADMRQYQQSGPEIEANTFASELLLPKTMINSATLKAEPDLDIIRDWSQTFNVSFTSAAVRYAGISRQPVMVVFSDGNQVRWWRRNEDRMAGLWFESEQRLGSCSIAADLNKNPRQAGVMRHVDWSAWFPHLEDKGEELFECAVQLHPYQTTLSLLWLPSRY